MSSAITTSGMGMAMSATKSHEPAAAMSSSTSVTTWRTLVSIARIIRGEKPWLRRRRWRMWRSPSSPMIDRSIDWVGRTPWPEQNRSAWVET